MVDCLLVCGVGLGVGVGGVFFGLVELLECLVG